jgi:hypothetical protein
MPPIDHGRAVRPAHLPDLLDKKSRSAVSRPIFVPPEKSRGRFGSAALCAPHPNASKLPCCGTDVMLWSAAGAEPSPALPLVFEEPILRLEHGEKLPAFGRRDLKLANELLFVTFELIKVLG